MLFVVGCSLFKNQIITNNPSTIFNEHEIFYEGEVEVNKPIKYNGEDIIADRFNNIWRKGLPKDKIGSRQRTSSPSALV